MAVTQNLHSVLMTAAGDSIDRINIRLGVFWDGAATAGDQFLLQSHEGEIVARGTAPYDAFDGFYPFSGTVDRLSLVSLSSGQIRILKLP